MLEFGLAVLVTSLFLLNVVLYKRLSIMTGARDRLVGVGEDLCNLVMSVDVENYRLSIAAGEIDAPPGYHGPIPDEHEYSDECMCNKCETTYHKAFMAAVDRAVENSTLCDGCSLDGVKFGTGDLCCQCGVDCSQDFQFDDFDDLTVEDLTPEEESELRDFGNCHDPKVTKLTEIMGVKISTTQVGALHPGSLFPHGEIKA